MYAVVNSATIVGVDASPVLVEVFVSGGLPNFTIVGLPGTAVQESRERVRAALKQLGIPLAPSRIVVNLAPADVRKEGPAFDLPIALGLLAAGRHIPPRSLERLLAYAELALDGGVRAVRGAVSVGVLAADAGLDLLAAPSDALQAAVVPAVSAYGPRTLAQAVAHLRGKEPLRPVRSLPARPQGAATLDLVDVRGQAAAKRALEIAAAGRHNLLLTGPPGAGKTMLAARLPGILPPLSTAEAVEVGRVHSAAGLSRGPGLDLTPPFRSPHHSGSTAGIIGGGPAPRPGEASLAHLGVLFLDEIPEFNRAALEALRQPLEAGVIQLSRASGSVTLPARFQLVAARNPCACGRLSSEGGGEGRYEEAQGGCICSPGQLQRYRRKLSGPLLDRLDLHLDLPRLTQDELLGAAPGEGSLAVAARVSRARQRMLARQGCANADLRGSALKAHAAPSPASEPQLRRLVARLELSARGFDRLLRVARTIADLADAERVDGAHLTEAGAYRAV